MATTNRVDSSIREIENAYKLGETLLKNSPKGIIHGATETLARKYRIKAEKVRKLRALADANRGFTRDQLVDQFNKFRKKGRSLTLSHLIRSLAIKNRNRRKGALGIALEKKLSSHLFQGLITSMQAKPHRAGRQHKAIKLPSLDQFIQNKVWAWERELALHLDNKKNTFKDNELKEKVHALRASMENIKDHGLAIKQK